MEYRVTGLLDLARACVPDGATPILARRSQARAAGAPRAAHPRIAVTPQRAKGHVPYCMPFIKSDSGIQCKLHASGKYPLYGGPLAAPIQVKGMHQALADEEACTSPTWSTDEAQVPCIAQTPFFRVGHSYTIHTSRVRTGGHGAVEVQGGRAAVGQCADPLKVLS